MTVKVTLLMALTADGKIARDAKHFPDWTGKADKRLFVRLTKKAGVMIMGRKTYDTIARPLPGRLNVVMTRDKRHQSKHPELIYTQRQPAQLLKWLEEMGYREVILAGGATVNDLFARERLIDEMVLTVSPLVFGEGMSLFSMALDLRLKLLEMEQIDEGAVSLRYEVLK